MMTKEEVAAVKAAKEYKVLKEKEVDEATASLNSSGINTTSLSSTEILNVYALSKAIKREC